LVLRGHCKFFRLLSMLLYLLFKLIVFDFNEVISKYINLKIYYSSFSCEGLILVFPHLITPIINQLNKQKNKKQKGLTDHVPNI
jgi:hypothetical protein